MKNKIEELFTKFKDNIETSTGYDFDYLDKEHFVTTLVEFGKLVCEEQKKICVKHAKIEVSNDSYEGYTEEDLGKNCNQEQLDSDKNKAPYSTIKQTFTTIVDYNDEIEYDETVKINEDSIINAPIVKFD